jgi:hypothetical protein
MKFVVCMDNAELGDLSADDLTIGRLYEVIEDVDMYGMLRIIDNSGDDYLYPVTLFESVEIPDSAAERLHHVYSRAG